MNGREYRRLKLVCAYAKAGSLKAASDAMELRIRRPRPRLISELETELGVALIDRSETRGADRGAHGDPPLRPQRIVKAGKRLSLTRDQKMTPVSDRVIRVSVPSNMSRVSFLDPVARFAEKA